MPLPKYTTDEGEPTRVVWVGSGVTPSQEHTGTNRQGVSAGSSVEKWNMAPIASLIRVFPSHLARVAWLLFQEFFMDRCCG